MLNVSPPSGEEPEHQPGIPGPREGQRGTQAQGLLSEGQGPAQALLDGAFGKYSSSGAFVPEEGETPLPLGIE